MFKKGITGSSKTKVKSSVQRQIRAKLLHQYPLLESYVEEIFPKKSDLELIKADKLNSPEKLSIYAIGNDILFFQHHDDTIYPHLKLVHKFPQCFPTLQVDRGAIRFILSGAQLMCPGLTSAGARLPPPEESLPAGTVVVIAAEGKENACMVGLTKMSTEDIKKVNRDAGVENVHYLGDGLWGYHVE